VRAVSEPAPEGTADDTTHDAAVGSTDEATLDPTGLAADGPAPTDDSGPRSPAASDAHADDAAVLARMRLGDEDAWAEFYERFMPMLRLLARRLRRHDEGAEQLAEDVLTDVADRLARETTPAPARLAAYLAAAFTRRLADAVRTACRRRALEARAAEDVSGSAERVLRDVVSEYAVRASAGPGREGDLPDARRLAPALARLAAALGDACTAEERVLLRLLADRVPQPEAARELGLTYGAARARIHRFRKRVWRWASAYVAELPEHERAEIRRFLRRAGGAAALVADSVPPHPSPRRRAAAPPETSA
jgi:RNA polymerase sigma factor (sigma-70 family)